MMNRSDRAKQFMPFDAMKGLKEALREREERHSRVDKRMLTEENIQKISDQLQRISLGDSIAVTCYRGFHEVTVSGKLTQIDFAFKFLAVDDEKILFDDIYDIEII